MKPRNKIIKLPAKEAGMIAVSVFQTENTNQYFTKVAENLLHCSSIEFKLWSKGNRTENQIAASLGKYITPAQVSDVIQKLASKQFSLKCESQSVGSIDIMFNLYDDNIEILCSDSLEATVMALFADLKHDNNI